jgi:hypothetical protein
MVGRKVALSLCAALCAGVGAWGANAAGYDWQSVVVGGGGYVPGIVFHPTGKGIMYARTDMGGAYRWNTATDSWIPILDWNGRASSDNYGVLSIALDPQDTNKVFLLTGKYTSASSGASGYVLASSDGGRTFSQQTQLNGKVGGNEDWRGAGERLAVDPNLGSILFWAGTRWDLQCWWACSDGSNNLSTWYRGSLWKSADGGKTFDTVKSMPQGNGLFVLFDPASGTKGSASQDIYASYDSSNAGAPAIWRSRNGGTSWSLLAGQPSGLYATHATVAGSNIFFSFNNAAVPNNSNGGAVWRFNTKTSSWLEISPVKNPTFGYGTVSAYGSDPSRLVVSTVDKWNGGDEVWLSTDTGKTWQTKLSTGTLDNSWAPWSTVRSPHWLSSVQYDPFDSSVALFGTGYGVFRTTNLLSSKPTWAFADSNFEETVPQQLVSPPYGAPLLSAMGDQGGFRHARLDKAPSNVHLPDVGTTLAIEVAWNKPSTFVKASNAPPSGGSIVGAISTDSGKTWTAFAAQPAGIQLQSASNNWSGGGGERSIAISADASSIVWTAPNTSGPYYSKNSGSSWIASTGGPSSSVISAVQPVADKVNGKKLYILDQQGGAVYASADGGATFTKGGTTLPVLPSYSTGDGVLTATPGFEGDLWATTGAGGLWHSTNSATSFGKITGVTEAYLVGVGKAAANKTYPAVYIFGVVGGVTGIFRSTDSAVSWTRINDDQHQYGTLHYMVGDPNVFGRVYIGTEGRGVIYGQPSSGPNMVAPVQQALASLRRVGQSLIADGATAIRLMDLEGRFIRQSETVAGQQRLDLTGLPQGVFFARRGAESLRVETVR